MRFIFSIIKNFIAVLAIIVIIYIALKYAPFLRDQEWNPLNHSPDYVQQGLDNSHNPTNVPPAQPEQGESYSLKNNDIINNVPSRQIKNVFNMIDKREFMSVSGMGRMGYNDKYLAGQRGNEFIIYKFGSDSIRVYNTEFEMQQDLNKLDQHLELKPADTYN